MSTTEPAPLAAADAAPAPLEAAPAALATTKAEQISADQHAANLGRQKALKAIKRPDSEEHEKARNHLIAQLQDVQKAQKTLRGKIQEIDRARQADDSNLSALRTDLDTKRQIANEKRLVVEALQGEKKEAAEKQENQRKLAQTLRGSLRFKSIAAVDEAIGTIEHRMQTQTLTLNEEKALMAEISQLKATKPDVRRFEEVEKQGQGRGKEGAPALAALDEARNALSDARKLEQAAFAELKQARDSRQTVDVESMWNRFRDFSKQYDVIKAHLQAEDKDFKEKNEEFNTANRELRKLQTEIAQYKSLHSSEKKPSTASSKEVVPAPIKEEEILPAAVPWEYEMQKCDNLIVYLKKFQPSTAAAQPVLLSSSTATVPESSIFHSSKSQDELAKKEVIGVGAAPEPKKKKDTKASAPKTPLTFPCPVGVLTDFNSVGVPAPLFITEIDGAIAQLEARKASYKTTPAQTKAEAVNSIAKETVEATPESADVPKKKGKKQQPFDATKIVIPNESEVKVSSAVARPVQWGPARHS
jgi:uncharacterized coiled-coil DUF342 family protein